MFAGVASPEASAGVLSRLTFAFFGQQVTLAGSRPLQQSDLYALKTHQAAQHVTERLTQAWAAELERARAQRRPPALLRALAVAFGWEWLQGGIPLKAFWLGFVLLQVYAVKGLIVLLGSAQPHPGEATGYVLMLCTGVQGVSLCQHHIFARSQSVGMCVRTALCGAVFRQVLALRAADVAAAGLTSGSLNNVLLSDTRRIEEVRCIALIAFRRQSSFLNSLLARLLNCVQSIVYSHFTWHAVVELLVIFGVAVAQAGLPALAGAAAILALVQLSRVIAAAVGRRRREAIRATDVRVRLTKEVLQNARAVKLNGWVPPMAARLARARLAESLPLRAAAHLRSSNSTIRDIAAPAAALATFSALAASSGGVLQPVRVFTVMALFNAVLRILSIAPLGLQAAAEAASGMQRIQDLLVLRACSADESAQDASAAGFGEEECAASLRGSYAWSYEGSARGCARVHAPAEEEPAEKVTLPEAPDVEAACGVDVRSDWGAGADGEGGWLRGLDVRLARGSLTAVVGPVGAGKSSLLLALLGELHSVPDAGAPGAPRRALCGRCAYSPQEAWVVNATLRENVLLRRPCDEGRYQAALDACALQADLRSLPAGDATEVGERGVTLSGGQKARVSLARAAYSDAELYLLDDPLAAVDAATAKHLMERCVQGLLAGKTRVLVTHALQWLPLCDAVLVLSQGRVLYHGPPQPSAVPAPLALRAFAEAGRRSLDGEQGKPPLGQPAKPHALVVPEDRTEGEVTGATYRAYAAAAGGAWAILSIGVAYALQALAYVTTMLWLAWWSDGTWGLSLSYNVGIYAAIAAGSGVLSLARSRSVTLASLKAASSLHDAVLERVLRSPVSFFDENPVGRVLNRFAKDQATLDAELPTAMQACSELFSAALAGFCVVAAILPFFGLLVPPLLVVFRRCHRRYVALSREAKRLDGVSRSPVLSHFGVVLAGAPCVRVFQVGHALDAEFHALLDANNRAFWTFVVGGRWLGIRLDSLAAVAAAAAAACVAGARSAGANAGAQLPPGLAGMALVAALTFSGTLQYATRQLSELENSMTSVERLVAYTHLPSEASPTTQPGVLPPRWPAHGELSVQSLTVRYSPRLAPTLSDVTFHVAPGHKIGLLGRTGAGKSTLVCALFRLVENAGCSGSIVIDGVDIARVGLDDLRRCVALIPQEPVLFAGTMRDNLDPFGEAVEADVAALLLRLGLARRAGGAGLDAPVSEAGDNVSAGEKQLVCLGRALLRRSRLLVCDEATAHLDAEADARIQEAIRADFHACTVITVAHRLDTIMACDQAIVLAPGGTLGEQGEPASLLERSPRGLFAEMVWATGEAHAAQLMAAARAAREERRRKR